MVGDSYINRLEARARTRQLESTVGASKVQKVKWMGQGGMKWQQLLPKIQYAALHNAAPKAIVVHVGSNDLAYQKGVVLIHNMKDDLSNLVQTFTNSAIFVSAMLPRIVWSGTQVPDKMDSKRKFINRVIRRFIKYNGRGVFIDHPEITSDTPGLYKPDGAHLSDIGSDILMLDIREALQDQL